jgi:Surface antigen variable number repeat
MKPMIRKPDKYLLLFLLMIVLRPTLNAERLTLNAERLTQNAERSTINGQRSSVIDEPPTANSQPPTANSQPPAANSQPPTANDTLPPGVIIISPGQGQLFMVGNVFIHGNRVTKSFIIERELPFKSGDSLTLQQLTAYFIQSREHLVNTRLFNEVTVSLKEFRGYAVDINVDVKERWYIFPLPYVRPVDRNFTAWADHGYSLSRFDYGLKYSQYNFTGRNDNLRVWLITGYSREIEMAYDRPNTGKNLIHGFGGGFLISGLSELNVVTTNNQQVFVNRDSIQNAGKYMQTQATFSLRYYYRPAIRTKHFFRVSFNELKIDSAVLFYNPNYFLNHRLSLVYPEFFYSLNYNNIDYVPYPTRGLLFEASILQRGFTADMNMTQLIARSTEAFSFAPKMYFVTQNFGVLRLPFKQSFYNQQLLGYGDYYMRGLEKYVVDGVGLLLDRNTVMRELFHFNIPFLPNTSHDHIPFRIYAKTYVDLGYVLNRYNNQNSLQNTLLYTYGAGFDVVTFYDFVFRIEYSVNQLGEKGLFFHIRNDF